MKLVLKAAVLSILLHASTAAAQDNEFSIFANSGEKKNDAPPVTEYNTVRPGMMMDIPHENTEEAGGEGHEQAVTERILTMGEINEKYKKGQFKEVLPSLAELSKNGLAEAAEMLGIMYRMGQGVEKNPQKAFEYISQAAQAGRPLAEHNLGVMYFLGEGPEKSEVKSMVWLQMAVLHYREGPEKKRALQDLDNIQKRLTRRDRERAMDMTRDLLTERGEAHLLDLR